MRNSGPKVPDAASYVAALAAIHAQITENQRELLRAHWSSPRHIATATQLAKAIGSNSYRAVNLQYGLLGARLREHMNYTAPGGQQSYVIAWLEPPSPGGEWRWHMHPPLALALEQMGWVKKSHHQDQGPVVRA